MYVLGAYGRSWGPTVGCIHPKTGHGTHPLFNRDNMVVEQLRMAPRACHVTPTPHSAEKIWWPDRDEWLQGLVT